MHLYSLQFNFRFAEKGWFLNTTDSGKIAYTTNQNREMKKKKHFALYLQLHTPSGSTPHFLGFELFAHQIFSSKFNLHLRKREVINRIKMVSAKTTSLRAQVGRTVVKWKEKTVTM